MPKTNAIKNHTETTNVVELRKPELTIALEGIEQARESLDELVFDLERDELTDEQARKYAAIVYLLRVVARSIERHQSPERR